MDRAHVWLLAATLALASFVLGGLVVRRALRLRERLRGRAHNTRGQRGERAAERLLTAHGYQLLARQVAALYPVEVDREPVEVALHADFLVARGGRRFVAEVKTGRNAPRFEHAETRRQLLEYQLAFAVDSVLLVDVEGERLREVRFPVPRAGTPSRAPGWLLVCVVCACFAYWLAKH